LLGEYKMEVKPVEQIDVRVNLALMEDITDFFETLEDKKEEDTEDHLELNFED